MLVKLQYASIPQVRMIAVHYWFVTEGESRDRWEVWQESDARGLSVGHLHRNLLHPDSHVGGGPTRIERTWDMDRCLS